MFKTLKIASFTLGGLLLLQSHPTFASARFESQIRSALNFLAEIYIQDARYQEIPPLLNKAEKELSPFRWGSLFNFYPSKKLNGINIRAPRFMYLAPQ